jgi:ribosomal protein L18E
MPLYRRIPKRGFKNALWKKDIATLNLSALDAFEDGAEVDEKTLREKGLVKKGKDGIKILGGGEIKKKLVVKATAFSKSASDKIVAAGGKYIVVTAEAIAPKTSSKSAAQTPSPATPAPPLDSGDSEDKKTDEVKATDGKGSD